LSTLHYPLLSSDTTYDRFTSPPRSCQNHTNSRRPPERRRETSDMPAQMLQHGSDALMTKVAIVEDNATFRQYLAQLIDRTPEHRCVCACPNAETALVEIPRHKPDVVLMDIHLPGESGIACTARLREKTPAIQVIML